MRSKKIKVLRHSKFFIFLHWLIVFEILLLLLTGFSLSEGLNFSLISRGTARSLHIVVGLIWLGTVVFFLYYFVISGEYKWFGLSRIGYAFDFFVNEVKTFLEGKRVQELIRYDPKRREYVEKIVPTEVLAWWSWFLLWVIIGSTGLDLLFPKYFGLIHRFWHAVVTDNGNPVASTRGVHFLTAIFIVAMALVHVYAAWVFGMLKSIFLGTREEPEVENEDS